MTPTSAGNQTQFLEFVQKYALQLRSPETLPQSRRAWDEQRPQLRARLIASWGGFPQTPGPLKIRVVGQFQRDGYGVEKVLLETRPGVQMTANVYIPDGNGPHPAMLCVHGHWPLAKHEPTVQKRCIGLVRLGFVVLMVDAFGAGERGIQPELGEYHGEMVAGTLWPTGLALAGIQVYENMRAVDYLTSRTDVDAARIGVTGCSGGGNQTMYVGAIDERLKCVVPVCSVGTYQAYLGAACCMCEVTPSVLTYTEESGVLGLVAPRALMLINATQDAFQFSVGEARKTFAQLQHIFCFYGRQEAVRHVSIEAGHGYNRAMREAMYGWVTRHLKGQGDGAPIEEGEMAIEAPETLRCFADGKRPTTFVTVPRYAAAEARRLLQARPIPNHRQHWQSDRSLMVSALPKSLGMRKNRLESMAISERRQAGDWSSFEVISELGISLRVSRLSKGSKVDRLKLLLDFDRSVPPEEAEADEWHIVQADLRGTGALANSNDGVGRAVDHNSAEWSLWIGRPLLGQWVQDVRRILDAVEQEDGQLPEEIMVVGRSVAGIVALCAAALDPRITHCQMIGSLTSYISDTPYEKQRLGIMVPGILRDVGDIPHIASLVSPRPLSITGGVDGAGAVRTFQQLREDFAYAIAAFALDGAQNSLQIATGADS